MSTIKIVDNIKFDWLQLLFLGGTWISILSILSLRNVVWIEMTDWAFLLSHPRYHQKNLELLNILLNNYPLSFIFDTINSRLKYLLRKRDFISKKKKERDIMNVSYNTPWFTVPYQNLLTNLKK